MKFEQAFYTSANHLLKSSDNGIGICAASSTSRSFLTLAGQLAGRYQREKTMEYGSLEEAHIEQIVAYSTEFQRFTAAIIGPRKRREGDKRANGMCQVLIPEEGSKPEDTLLDFRGYANMTVAEDVVTDSVEAETYHLGLKDILNTYQISKEALASLLDLVYMSLLKHIKHRKTIVIHNDGEAVKSEQAALDITRLLLLLLPQEMQNRISIGLHAVLNFERVLLWYGTEKELEQAGGECDIWDIHSTEYTHMFAYDIAEMAMQATSDEEVCHRLNEIMADYHRDVTPSTNEQEMELAFARLRLENADRQHPAVVFMGPTAWQYLYNRAGRGEKWSEDTYLMYICQSDSEQIPKEGRFPLDFLLNKINDAEEWKKLSEQEQKQWIQAAVHCAAIYTDIRWENYLWICRQIKNPDVKSRFMNELQALDNSPVNRTFEDIEDFCKVSLAYSGWENPDYWDRAVAQATGYLNNPELLVEDENLLIKTMNDAGDDKWKETIHSIMLKRITSQEAVKEFAEMYEQYKDYLDLEKDKDALLDWGEKAFENGDDEALLLKTMNDIDGAAWKEKISPVMLKRITPQETVKEFAEMYEQYKNYLDLEKDKDALLDWGEKAFENGDDEALLLKTMNDIDGAAWKEKIRPVMLKRITSQETVKEFAEMYEQYKNYLDLEKDKDALLDWGEKAFENGDDEVLLLKTMKDIDSGAWKKKISPVMLKRITSQETVKEFAKKYEQYKVYLDMEKDKEVLLDAMGELYQKPVLTDRESLSKLAKDITSDDAEWNRIALSALEKAVTAEKLVELCTEDEIEAVEKRYIDEYYQKLVSVRTLYDAQKQREKLKEIATRIEKRAENPRIELKNKQTLHDTFDEWDFYSLKEKVMYDPQTEHMFEYYFNYVSNNLENMKLYQLVTIAETLKSCKERYPDSKVDIAPLKTRIWSKTNTETETSSSISGDTEKNLLLVRLKIWCALHEGDKMDFDFFGGVLKKKSYDDLKDILEYLKGQDSDSAAELFATTPNYTKNGSTIHKEKKIPLCYLIWFTYCEEERFPEHLLKEMTVTQSKDKVNHSWKLDELRAQNLCRIKDQSEQEKVLKSAINYLCLLVWDNEKPKNGTDPTKQGVLKTELSRLGEEQKDKLISVMSHYDKTQMGLPTELEKQLNTLKNYMMHNVQEGGCGEKTSEQRTQSSEWDQKFEDTLASLREMSNVAKLNGENGNGEIGYEDEGQLKEILGTN